jgi:hypothetical protein
MTDETKERAPTTRAYVMPDGTVEFRCGGFVNRMDLADAETAVIHDLAIEGAILLVLRNASVASVLDGTAIPKRTPPSAKTKVDPELEAAIAQRTDEIYELTKPPGRLGPAQRDAARAEAEAAARAWIAERTPEQLKAVKKHATVKARMLAAKNAGSLGEMFQPTPEVAAPKLPEFMHEAAE